MLSGPEKSSLTSVPALRTVFLLIFVCFLGVVLVRSSASLKGTDFPDFYCAARMVAAGQGKQLYNAGLQRQFQERYAGGVGTLYIHPPFESLIYLPLAWLPMRWAYLLWSFSGIVLLGIGVRRMADCCLSRWDWRILLACSLLFVPVLLCLMQGQDSLLFLALVILAFTGLRSGRFVAAGCWLAVGLFKFQLVLPIALVIFLACEIKAKREFAKGFAIVAAGLSFLSAIVSGVSSFWIYPEFLLHRQAEPYSGVAPQAMANIRGFTWLIFRGQLRDQYGESIAVIAVFSASLLIFSLLLSRSAGYALDNSAGNDTFDLAFANTIIFALLVSYYLNPHDLTVALIPIFVMLHHAWSKKSGAQDAKTLLVAGCICILFLPPLHLWTLSRSRYCLMSLPLMGLFFLGISWVKRKKIRVDRRKVTQPGHGSSSL